MLYAVLKKKGQHHGGEKHTTTHSFWQTFPRKAREETSMIKLDLNPQ